MDNIGKEILKELASMNNHLEAIDIKLDNIETRLDSMDTRLSNVENRLDAVEAGLSNVEARLDAVEARLSNVENRLDAVEAGLSNVEARIGNVETDIVRMNTFIENHVNRNISLIAGNYVVLEKKLSKIAESQSLKIFRAMQLSKLEFDVKTLKEKTGIIN